MCSKEEAQRIAQALERAHRRSEIWEERLRQALHNRVDFLPREHVDWTTDETTLRHLLTLAAAVYPGVVERFLAEVTEERDDLRRLASHHVVAWGRELLEEAERQALEDEVTLPEPEGARRLE